MLSVPIPIMSVAEALLRTLVPFPKLLIAIAKRCSSATLHLLRYLFSSRNASAQKRKREHSSEDNADPSRLPGIGAEVGASVESATILCWGDEGSASGRRLSPRGTETPAAVLSAEGRGSNLSIPRPSVRRSTNLLESNPQIIHQHTRLIRVIYRAAHLLSA